MTSNGWAFYYIQAKRHLEAKHEAPTFKLGKMIECNGQLYYVSELGTLWKLIQADQLGDRTTPFYFEIETILKLGVES